MNRSTIIVVVCLVLIVAAGAWIFLRPDSGAQRARRNAGRRICTACGHEWYKDRGELIREAKNSADGSGFNQCPNCGAWRGVSVVDCPHCGKPYAATSITEDADGNIIATGKVYVCPYCRYNRRTKQVADPEPEDTD